jgi:hypothetical protein
MINFAMLPGAPIPRFTPKYMHKSSTHWRDPHQIFESMLPLDYIEQVVIIETSKKLAESGDAP